jgi:hypothetical protein
MYKIIGADQKEYGPITADQLRQWISEGRINANTKVQAEGSGVWKTVSELPEFGLTLPPPPPSGPKYAPGGPISMGPPPEKTNMLAVWSMICGIVGVFCCQIIIGPLALILGIVGLSQIKKNPHEKGSGMAITGIILGILALLIGIGAVIFMLLFPNYLKNLPNFPNNFPQ